MNFQISGVTPFSQAQNNGAALENSANLAGGAEFQTELTAAISATLEKFGLDPSKVSITIGPSAGNSALPSLASPMLTTPPANPTTPATSSGPDLTSIAMQKKMSHWYANDPADDAYWNSQPAPIQQLREIDDYDQRLALATKLAGAGYKIDYPIMVMGMDAGKTIALRQAYGYSWVPSMMQNPVGLAPGLSFPGTLQAYDPTSAPDGSIAV